MSWTGAHSWTNPYAGGGTSNGAALLKLKDSVNKMAFEVHQYMDLGSSGTLSVCLSKSVGADSLKDFTKWLRTNHKTGFLSEFGAANNSTCVGAHAHEVTGR